MTLSTINTNGTLLIETDQLARRIGDPSWILFDCRFNLADPAWGRNEYAKGHIPSALYAHLDEDLSSPVGPKTGRHPLPDPVTLSAKLGQWGVDTGTQVVVYDDAGGVFAVRLWWLLRWLGHQRVAVLNGGLGAWLAEARVLDQSTPTPAPHDFSGNAQHSAWISTEVLENNLETGHYLVLDARVPERFRGEMEPIDPVAGHIPGAINMPLSENLGADGRFLTPDKLRTRFISVLDTTPTDRVVHQCGSGVNACHNLLAMELAGFPGSKLYAGSWSEWIRSTERAVATGNE